MFNFLLGSSGYTHILVRQECRLQIKPCSRIAYKRFSRRGGLWVPRFLVGQAHISITNIPATTNPNIPLFFIRELRKQEAMVQGERRTTGCLFWPKQVPEGSLFQQVGTIVPNVLENTQ
jgi:hypothetical protein